MQHFWGSIVDRRLTDPHHYDAPTRPADEALIDAFDQAHDLLVRSMRDTPDDVAVWTWAAGHRHVGFVRRRQAHEALIHRVDAELLSGGYAPLDPELATDGVHEALHHMFGGLPEWATVDEQGPTGRLVAADTGTSWTVRTVTWSGTEPSGGVRYDGEPGLVVVADTAADPSFTVRGAAGDLDAWVWSRPTIDPLERTGDTSAVDAVLAAGVQ